jgi:raffinose/stachyose/melibiose transport system permease protein
MNRVHNRVNDLRALQVRNGLARTITYVVLVFFALLALFPFVWSLLSSLKTNDEILVRTFSLPRDWKFSNYPHAWVDARMGVYFLNTVLYASVSTSALVMGAAMAGYVIARVKPRQWLYTFYTLGIMIPVHTILLPVFMLTRNLGLINTRASIVIVYIAFNISLSVFILVGFLRSLPVELEEAAVVDGGTRSRVFFSIVLPLSTPGLATIGTLAFLNNWNDFLVPLIMLTNDRLKVITQGIQELRGQYAQDYGLMTAGIVISFIPVIILYIAFQEKLIRGLTAGAVKG